MEKKNEQVTITEALMNVFHYAFIESVPYNFFIPTKDKYVAVNLTQKIYHCLACGKTLKVKYNQNGVVYFSTSRFEQQRVLYGKLGLTFPEQQALQEEKPFDYHAEGYCNECAPNALQGASLEQEIYQQCLAIHHRDEGVLAEARLAMRGAVERWVKQITDSSQLSQYDLSNYTAMKDLICAVILRDLSAVETCLTNYRMFVEKCSDEIRANLSCATDQWQCYAAMPTAIYESMSDELYHEYTVAFPVKETIAQDFYVRKPMEKSRVDMFIMQKRIDSVEELIMEAGFMDEWVDLFIDHVTALEK